MWGPSCSHRPEGGGGQEKPQAPLTRMDPDSSSLTPIRGQLSLRTTGPKIRRDSGSKLDTEATLWVTSSACRLSYGWSDPGNEPGPIPPSGSALWTKRRLYCLPSLKVAVRRDSNITSACEAQSWGCKRPQVTVVLGTEGWAGLQSECPTHIALHP